MEDGVKYFLLDKNTQYIIYLFIYRYRLLSTQVVPQCSFKLYRNVLTINSIHINLKMSEKRKEFDPPSSSGILVYYYYTHTCITNADSIISPRQNIEFPRPS